MKLNGFYKFHIYWVKIIIINLHYLIIILYLKKIVRKPNWEFNRVSELGLYLSNEAIYKLYNHALASCPFNFIYYFIIVK